MTAENLKGVTSGRYRRRDKAMPFLSRVFLIGLLFAGVGTAAFAQPASKSVDSAFGIFGAYAQEYPWFKRQMGFSNEDYWNWVERHFQILGAHWTRSNLHLIWEIIEPDIGGGYDWNVSGWAGNLTDDTITHVYNSPAGVHWLGVFGIGGPHRNPLDYPAKYAAFVQAAVERYDGDGVDDVSGGAAVKYWQAGNETPQWHHSRRNADDYVAWVRLLRKAALQADPEAKIVLIAPCQCFKPDDFLVAVIKKLAPAHEFDAIDIHHWGKAGNWKMTALPHYRALLDELGLKHVQIWSCENGTWVGKPDREPFQTEQQQGRSLVKRYVWSRANGLDKLFWNNLMEWDAFSGRPGSIYNSMGLVSDGHNSNDPPERINTKRAAYWSYKLLAFKTDNASAVLAGTIKGAHDDKEVFAYEYVRNANGKHFYILWSESGKKEITFAVPEANYHATNMIHDRFGNSLEEYDVKAVDGKLAIALGKDPVLVEPADRH